MIRIGPKPEKKKNYLYAVRSQGGRVLDLVKARTREEAGEKYASRPYARPGFAVKQVAVRKINKI